MKFGWTDGNRVRLLENGEQYYPQIFAAVEAAQRDVFIETFILFDDVIGRQLQAVLIAAGRRGVRVELTVDGHGSAYLPEKFVRELADAGVRVHVFDPQILVFGIRTNPFRRLHRKLVVVDGRVAFIGGINFSHDHVRDYGPQAKQDYAVEVEGPVVRDIERLVRKTVGDPPEVPQRRWWQRWRAAPATAAPVPLPPKISEARCLFVTRDNDRHKDDIERHYRDAIRAARRDIVIANAYFFPGYRLLKDLKNAVRRGVRVRLILQGHPDMPLVKWIEGTLYDYLVRSGVEIHEYCERPLHGKVAVIDDEWATVGSSNLDPPSLSLNLESNLVIRDREFADFLRGRLEALVADHCKRIGPESVPKRTRGRQLLTVAVFHFLRKFPAWAGKLPAAKPVPELVAAPPAAQKGAARLAATAVPERRAAQSAPRKVRTARS